MRLIIAGLVVVAVALIALPAGAADDENFICWDPYQTFNPLTAGGSCLSYKEDGSLLLIGQVIYAGHVGQPAVARAYIGNQLCGDAPGPSPAYLLVRSAGQQAGCGAPGLEVRFEIGGVPAAETLVWPEHTFPAFLSLTALQGHAWYWYQNAEDPPAAGATIEAVVDGVVCDGTTMSAYPPVPGFFVEGLHGFSRLLVAPDGTCAATGRSVSFWVNGVRSVQTYQFGEGVQRITRLEDFVGDADCAGDITTSDAALMLQRAAGVLAELPCPEAGDVDGDGLRNVVDVLLVLQFDAGVIERLG